MVMQLPDEMGEDRDRPPVSYAYLMQFMDGNRIDLTIFPLAHLHAMARDSLSVLLLDKDGIIEPYSPPHEGDYLPQPPSALQFFDRCNEFWWVSPYVAKALWRGEILYAKQLLDGALREQLMACLLWYVGMKTEFAVSTGKAGKHFKRYLEPAEWELLLRSYSDADCERTWEALLAMGALFHTVGGAIADFYGYEYPQRDDERVTAYLHHIRRLDKAAEEIY
jgi:aminoglycoside 6-adenylyltransferase